MWVRENGVEVGSESFERDVLLRTAWSVWEARVVGTLEKMSSLVVFDLAVSSCEAVKAWHTEEDGEKSDLLFVGRWDCFSEHLMVSVVGPLL